MERLYISPFGNDENNALKASPVKSIAALEREITALRSSGYCEHIECIFESGDYFFEKPYKITPQFNNVTFCAAEDKTVKFTSEREITGFKACVVNGVNAVKAYIPQVEEGTWYFRSLFVNQKPASRTRMPQTGYYHIKSVPGIDYNAGLFDSSNSFVYNENDILNYKNPTDTEIVVLHYWIEERFPVSLVNEAKKIVHLGKNSTFSLKDDFKPRYAKYYVENAFEGLKNPGEWYLNRLDGMLYYIPQIGENIDNLVITAPTAYQLLTIEGDMLNDKRVEKFSVNGIEFCNTDWFCPVNTQFHRGIGINYASSPQASSNIAGVISFYAAKDCSIKNCKITNVGMYGIEIADACSDISITQNEICEIGGGGVKVNGADIEGRTEYRTLRNDISFNHIYNCGNVFYSGAGIFIQHSSDNTICNNHIHDLYYSGISAGWTWGYAPNTTYNNQICKNLIHDLGKGVLSDMGGVYLLGIQPQTVVRNNIIFNIKASNYGGWALYTDEGSTGIAIEDNICYDTSSHVFHQHYGKDNFIRNNILCFGGDGVVAFPRGDSIVYNEGSEKYNQYNFNGNIVVVNNSLAFHNKYGETHGLFKSDNNIFFDISGSNELQKWLADWQKQGYDKNSVILDPQFKDIANFDFTLDENSPAVLRGFTPIDTSKVGNI